MNKQIIAPFLAIATLICLNSSGNPFHSIFTSILRAITPVKSVQDYHEQVIGHKGTCVVKFYAPWCSACTSIKRFYSDLARTYTDLTFYEVNISLPENKPLIKDCGLRMLPTFFVFKDGSPVSLTDSTGQINDRLVGTDECPQLENNIQLLSQYKKNTGYCWLRRSNRVKRGKSASAIPTNSTNISQG